MIVCPGNVRAIYVCIPKTATAAIRQHLMRRYGGRPKGAYHQARLADPGPGWTVFSSVRHPYTRLVSWWWFTAVARLHQSKPAERAFWKDRPLKGFLRWLLEHIDGHDVRDPEMKLMRLPQHRFLDHSRPDHVVRIERLDEEFGALPFAKPDDSIVAYRRTSERGHSWRHGGKTWLDYYDQETLDLANEYGAADEAEAFGYRPVLRLPSDPADECRDPSPIGPVAWTHGAGHR